MPDMSVCLSGLVNPKAVESLYGAHNTKEVLSPLRVAEYNQTGPDPHYCSTTSNLQVSTIITPMTSSLCKGRPNFGLCTLVLSNNMQMGAASTPSHFMLSHVHALATGKAVCACK